MNQNAAQELAERQRKYDLLHHRKRVADIGETPRCWIERDMLRQSKAIIADPDTGTRCVDLDDAAYIAELDAFACRQREGT